MLLRPVLVALAVLPGAAHAFCGFYVAGGGAALFNDATQVVLMREGTKTVLSLQNNYRGPPENFAMVIPVPVVLQQENVKTLTRNLFDKVDQLAAPRLVEYWEQDPCYEPPRPSYGGGGLRSAPMKKARMAELGADEPRDYGVAIEAQFTVGEYEIVVLSAKDALGLEAWLTDNKYKIPSGAAPLFRPYIQQGMKFFVARVDVKKVTFTNDVATLSPLRFHYDSEKFELPVRLGLINAKGEQDLIVHILARNQRYEVANYPNNNFQARYAIRCPWEGPIACSNPVRGKWGGPPNGGRPKPVAAEDLGLVKRDEALTAKLVESPLPELGLKGMKARAGIPVKK